MFWDPKPVLRGGLDIRQLSRLHQGMVDQSPGPGFLDRVKLVSDCSKPLLSLITSHRFTESGHVRESDILGQG